MALIVYVTVGILKFATKIATLVTGQHAVGAIAALQSGDLALFRREPARLMRCQAAIADTLTDLRLLAALHPVDAARAACLVALVETTLMPPVAATMPALPVAIMARLLNMSSMPVEIAMNFAALAARKIAVGPERLLLALNAPRFTI
jgi:hypothetical protein